MQEYQNSLKESMENLLLKIKDSNEASTSLQQISYKIHLAIVTKKTGKNNY